MSKKISAKEIHKKGALLREQDKHELALKDSEAMLSVAKEYNLKNKLGTSYFRKVRRLCYLGLTKLFQILVALTHS